MSSYLNIYLEKKKKEGEEKGERLLLCSISRVNEIYNVFYDHGLGSQREEDGMHEFTSNDISSVIDDVECNISSWLYKILHIKETLPLITEKDTLADMIEELESDKEYLQELMDLRATLSTLSIIFSDVNEEWCAFDKLYWKID